MCDDGAMVDWILLALGVGLALFGGAIAWNWFARHFRGEPQDPGGAESAVYLLVGGVYALVIVVMLAVTLGFDLLSRLRWI